MIYLQNIAADFEWSFLKIITSGRFVCTILMRVPALSLNETTLYKCAFHTLPLSYEHIASKSQKTI